MKTITREQIKDKLETINLPRFDLIVAIANDGIKPAEILKQKLNIPIETIYLNYRDKDNRPIRQEPELTKPISINLKNLKDKNILIVDSISKTGKTLNKAKEILKENNLKTFVINGKADYSLFDYEECIDWQF